MSAPKTSRKGHSVVSIAKEAARYDEFKKNLHHFTAHTVVVGDGWSALFACWLKVSEGQAVTWIAGTGSSLIPMVTGLETTFTAASSGLSVAPSSPFGTASASQILRQWVLEALPGLDLGRLEAGCFIREFRNKSFRPPSWVKPLDAEARFEVREDALWECESRVAPLFEERFERDLWTVQDLLRDLLLNDSRIFRLAGLPVQEVLIEAQTNRVTGIEIGSGLQALGDLVIFADRLPSLLAITGMPRPLPLMRGREASSVLQAVFEHSTPPAWVAGQTVMTELHRDAGEDFHRHVWGYFVETATGVKSVWSVVLQSSEIEDNHEVAKKLRRMKQALDRVFERFSESITREQVRFEEASLLFKGEAPVKPLRIKDLQGVEFLTDGYGVASSLLQAAHLGPLFMNRVNQGEAGAQELMQAPPVLDLPFEEAPLLP